MSVLNRLQAVWAEYECMNSNSESHNVDEWDQAIRSVFPQLGPALWWARCAAMEVPGESRRAVEHQAGREAAVQALENAGVQPVWLASDDTGAPVWPPGVNGSISHSGNQAVCVVSTHLTLGGMGIDLEHVDHMDQEVARRCLTDVERQAIASAVDADLAHLMMLANFCAKEALIKCRGGWGAGLEDPLDFRLHMVDGTGLNESSVVHWSVSQTGDTPLIPQQPEAVVELRTVIMDGQWCLAGASVMRSL
ncbi:MAG: 4'-phosphopantetheinyl transferase superfamily protein [Planctomycetes bacterium]|nr:4'-phosphopantetheinyl transferase superfamily protein [Planctomycetota bacterium]